MLLTDQILYSNHKSTLHIFVSLHEYQIVLSLIKNHKVYKDSSKYYGFIKQNLFYDIETYVIQILF